MAKISQVLDDAAKFNGVDRLLGATGNRQYVEYCQKILSASPEICDKYKETYNELKDITTMVETAASGENKELEELYINAKEILVRGQ